METATSSPSRRTGGPADEFPAYGPIDAVLGYTLFYVVVDRVTPAVVEVFSETVLDLSPSFVGFGLAAALWFILAVTGIDQTRRQLAALGVGSYEEYQLRVWSRVTPASVRTVGYLAALAVGGTLAALTFERAIEALLGFIPVVATADVAGFDVVGVVALILFFVSYGVATHALDRLVIGAIRSVAGT
jgi:hypothetical protein